MTFAGLSGSDSWTFVASQTVQVRSRLVVNTAEGAIDAAVAGVGLTRVLSYQVADALRAGTLVIVLSRFEPPPLPVHLIHNSESLLTAKLRAFLDFAAPRLRERLSSTTASVVPARTEGPRRR